MGRKREGGGWKVGRLVFELSLTSKHLQVGLFFDFFEKNTKVRLI